MYRVRMGRLYVAPQLKLSRLHLSLGVTAMVLGVMVASQWSIRDLEADARLGLITDSRAISSSNITRLEEEQRALKARIVALQDQIARDQKAAAVRQQTLSGLTAELDRQRMLAGMTGLVGPGVRVILDDSTFTPAAADDPNNFIIHDYELRDVISLLWQAGADGVALNGERIVANTSLYCVGSTILVNSTRLSPPYVLTAIGDPTLLDEAMGNAGNLAKLKAAAKTFGIQLKVERLREITLLSFSGPVNVKYTLVSGESR
ncbi:MAG: DUF881 domain-containing protein [Chloroflexi bacterium]|nr:DUF881 domain-containing protein [Chloroflexota bacterium]